MAAEDKISASKEKLSSLIEPINGGVGDDVSYDEMFEKVKLEVDKMTSMAGGKVDWGMIVSSTDELLTEKSKDFRVAVYYAAAKPQMDGIEGALDGLVLLQELCAAFWEPMYPPLKRPKARGALMGWYSDVVAPIVAAYPPTAKDADLVTALDITSRAVDSDLREKLGDAFAGINALRTSIRNLLSIVPKEAPPPPPPPPPRAEPAKAEPARVEAPPPPPPPPKVEVPSGPSLASIVDADSALRVVGEVSLLLARAGDALRVEDQTNMLAYRFMRTGIWLELTQEPANEESATLVPSPPEHLRTGLEALAAEESWEALINAADEAAAEHVFWLDPHRHISNAMDQLGEAYLPAKQALLTEVALLVSRVPTLPSLLFDDGVPFADGITQEWIANEVTKVLGSGGGGGGAPVMTSGPRSTLDKPLAEARGLIANGDLPGAVQVVAKAVASAPTPVEKFKGRLALAKLCLQAEQYGIARAQLEGLERLVEQHRLVEWEPDLCADLYGSLYAAHRGANQMGAEPDVQARENAAFERLCQLDAGAALKLTLG